MSQKSRYMIEIPRLYLHILMSSILMQFHFACPKMESHGMDRFEFFGSDEKARYEICPP